jgi:hypothetical protein
VLAHVEPFGQVAVALSSPDADEPSFANVTSVVKLRVQPFAAVDMQLLLRAVQPLVSSDAQERDVERVPVELMLTIVEGTGPHVPPGSSVNVPR